MKYNCPYCEGEMLPTIEQQYCHLTGEPTVEYILYICKNKKTKCKIGTFPTYKIWEYQEQIQGISITFEENLSIYRIVSKYDLSVILIFKLKEDLSFNFSRYTSSQIIKLNQVIKIDPVDPINSGLSILNRLLKLRAFS